MKSLLVVFAFVALPIICQISIIRNEVQNDILLVNTLDGFIHGINKTTGVLLWSRGFESTGMVSVMHSTKETGMTFIPEPAANGDLYYIEAGKGLQKFNTSLKDIISNNLGTKDESFIYTGGKVTSVLAINPSTGEILKTIGGSKEPSECQDFTRNAVFISRTQYKLDIYNVHTNVLLWNISYVEYSPTSTIFQRGNDDKSVQNSFINSKENLVEAEYSNSFEDKYLTNYQVKADVYGNFRLVTNGVDHFFKTEFGTPVVGVFDLVSDEYGTHLFKPTHAPRGGGIPIKAYVGNYDGTLYLLSDLHFPFLDKDSSLLSLEAPKSNHHPNLDSSISNQIHDKESIYAISKNSLVGTYTLEVPQTLLIEEIVERTGVYSHTLLYIFCGFIFILVGLKYFNHFVFKKLTLVFQEKDNQQNVEKKRLLEQINEGMVIYDHLKSEFSNASDERHKSESKQNSSLDSKNSEDPTHTPNSLPSTSPAALKSLTVSEKVLGYGSHGTVVLEGKFEGRKVAIKRMLSDFYAVADQEVKMLQQSDYHPNVVRYFCKEESEGFMYIALEQCSGSIADLVANKDIPELIYIKKYMSHKEMFKQILLGLEHLHSLNIVHRDIKPQNILVSKSSSKPRMLISDFGLGKRLDDGQSSFHNTYVPGGGVAGTVGWRAPETLLAHHAAIKDSNEWNDHKGKLLVNDKEVSTTRITRSIDIFSLGCVIYYVVSNGSHPFGEQFSREMNILKGNFRLKHFDSDEEDSLLKDMIKRMVVKDSSKRISAEVALRHPYFWNTVQQLSFLQDLSDRLEIESKDPPSPLLKQLERLSTKVFGRDWTTKMNSTVLESMSKYRKYNGNSLQDLLRALRNKKNHYQDLSIEAQQELGRFPVEFLNYFLTRYPNLLVCMVQYVSNSEVLSRDALFSHYFPE